MAPTLITALIEVLLCLPTAPVLLLEASGDFGTSPIYEHHSDKRPLAYVMCMWGAWHAVQ
jgi:hypothetical protein